MKKIFALLILTMTMTVAASAQQEKGVDQQNSRIRDSSTNRLPGVNGGKVNTGTGRGIDFGKGRTEALPPVPNPYRFTVPNDKLTQAVQELMRDRKLILDDTASNPEQGVLITQPYTFTKGAVVTDSELGRVADVPQTSFQGWTRGRYTLIVEVQPIDGNNTNVSVNAKIEGKSDSITGAEWITLRSNGTAEQDFIIALVEKVTGGPPPGRNQ